MAKLAEIIHFDYAEELCDEVLSVLETEEDAWVSVVGGYGDIRAFIKEFLTYDDVTFECLDICSPKCNDYTSEYIVDIWTSNGKIIFDCEPAKVDDEYDYYNGDIIYMLDGTKQALANNCQYHEKYLVIIGEEDCDCCKCCDCDDDKIYGFTVNSEFDNGHGKFTYHSSDPVNKTDILNMLKNLGIRIN